MTATENRVWTALWVPGWYELDQPLVVGQQSRFWFFQKMPCSLRDFDKYDFVFFNQLNSASNCQVREARVVSIEHPELGALSQIRTDGLDYVFETLDGKTFVVNAEEDPGTIIERSDAFPAIDNWSVDVVLENVSPQVGNDT